MKKFIIIFTALFMSLIAVNANAQVVTNVNYCELVGYQTSILKSTVTVSVDFGQSTSAFSDNRLVDSNGKVIKFNSMVDAMNYMATMGWVFKSAYTIGANGQYIYHWLLEKNTGDENILMTKQQYKNEEVASESPNESIQ